MRILLTNDDGIGAPGIKALGKALANWAEIFVVAPEEERSATGHGITVHKPLRVEKVTLFGPNVHSWAINGTPTDCVKLAVEMLLDKPPNLIVSGINKGPNLATDVLYSGTVSAAIEGVIYGFPSVAVSVAGWENLEYQVAAKFSRDLCEQIYQSHLAPDTLLNVNVPNIVPDKIKGIQVTKLGSRRYQNIFDKREDPRGRVYYWMAGEVKDLDAGHGTDIWAIKNGYISVTPIHFDLTKHQLIKEVNDWISRVQVPSAD
ncbi:MAG: 5'/3'-nucleotidase SurE [Heliobacteriaceae bacterium]|nr:5'/3'-nucleotidase SurE [Heliobacteriaceae bacterium]MDD4586791.1 5'/3'-nucleotidase SurE [Heliobacteriaceae bacterium]